MRVQMKTQIGGYRDGVAWPAAGGAIEVPDHEAADLISNGYAVPAAADENEETDDGAGPGEDAASADDASADPDADSDPATEGDGDPQAVDGPLALEPEPGAAAAPVSAAPRAARRKP